MSLLTLWRIWHVHNEVVHDKPPPPLEVSRCFLMSYMESLINIKCHATEDIMKGKYIFDQDEKHFHEQVDNVIKPPVHWSPLLVGWCKLNVDGSFDATGGAGTWMNARDHGANIIFSACRQLQSCKDSLGSKLHAIMEGLSLGLNWCNLPILIGTDCLEMVTMLKSEDVDRSVHAPMIEEIKSLLKVRQTYINHVNHSQNSCSHFSQSR
jgi:hypothetical protein